jgi:GntR family transcriptional regulator of vanillate catabolism
VRLGVSRTPIRLAHEGLLEPYPTGGFIVRKFTLQDIWDSIEVRGLLEGGAARLAAERLVDDRELNPLHAIQQEMDAVGEPTVETFPIYLELNDTFHSEIMRLSKKRNAEGSFGSTVLFPAQFTARAGLRSSAISGSLPDLRH